MEMIRNATRDEADILFKQTRDEAAKRAVDGLSTLIDKLGEMTKEEENLDRFTKFMIHVREILGEIHQWRHAMIEQTLLLMWIELEVNKAGEIIDSYKSKNRMFRFLTCHFFASKLEKSSNDISHVLKRLLLLLTQISTELNIKETTDASTHGFESLQLTISSNSNAVLCGKDLSSTGKLELTSNSEQIIAERNAKERFLQVAGKVTVDDDDMETTNQAIGDLLKLMKEFPSCISAATENNCKLVPYLAWLLQNNSSEINTLAIECLLRIACFSDEKKEIIGNRGVINCLLRQSMMEPNAIVVLLELSRNKTFAGKIGENEYSIPTLISFLDHPSSDAAGMARIILDNLSTDVSSTVNIAKFGYFTPFLDQFNSQEISQETRTYMGEELAQIQLTETFAKNLENEGLISNLTEMLNSESPSTIMASLNCIKQHFITSDELKSHFLNNQSAISALQSLITGKSMYELKQKAKDILISIIPSIQPTNLGFHTVFSSSSDSLQNMVNRIKTLAPDNPTSISSLQSKHRRTHLIHILSSGSPLAKQRAATILSHLSRCDPISSVTNSSLVEEEDGCPVHGSDCSPRRFVCLVRDNAVKPLIETVKMMEAGSTEAALVALDTLFDAGCDFDGAAAAIVEGGGASPILEALERGEPCVKDKALELFRKIFKHPGITEMELDRFKGLVLNILRNEGCLKLKKMNLLEDLFP